MSDFSFDVNILLPQLEQELRSGTCPHAICIKAPKTMHVSLSLNIAAFILCDNNNVSDNCPACRGWVGKSHPDMIAAGAFDVPAKIDECRHFMTELLLKPVLSPRRVGVVFAADRLLLPAANSLLKITEEPPPYAYLLFMVDSNELLSTLKSRVRLVSFTAQNDNESSPLPKDRHEWLSWLENVGELIDIAKDLSKWSLFLRDEPELLELAYDIEHIRLAVESGIVTKATACDMILLTLMNKTDDAGSYERTPVEEGLPVERVLGNLW